jgi:hypothetical protein
VRGPAVHFDDKPLLAPDGVELAVLGEAVDARRRQTVGIEEGEEAALEVAAGERHADRLVFGEDAPQVGRPSAVGVSREEGVEGDRAGEPAVLRLVERVLELLGGDDGRQVEQRARRAGHADAVLDHDLVRLHLDDVKLQARRAAPVARNGDLDPGPGALPDGPELSSRAVTQRGARAAARTAAMHHPSRRSARWPTAYTPRCSGCNRPNETRRLIALALSPSSMSWARDTTPRWSWPSAAIASSTSRGARLVRMPAPTCASIAMR